MVRTIMVVDDEPMARNLLRLMLVRAGYEVLEAVDGADALRKLRRGTPDLVILDVMMPGVDGYSVCRQLRGSDATVSTPVIMLSARTDARSIDEGLRAGASRFLPKPITADQLTQHVRELLN